MVSSHLDKNEGGHLEVLQWAREHGCPWNESTCSATAVGGHLKVLQWAREHGCPWNEHTCAGHTTAFILKIPVILKSTTNKMF